MAARASRVVRSRCGGGVSAAGSGGGVGRRLLAAGAAGEEPVRLARRSGGYVLEVDPEDVDLHRFRQLALAARDRQRPDDERARLLREALDLWRGEPLADLPGEWPARMRHSWEEERLDAAVAWAQAELRMGRP